MPDINIGKALEEEQEKATEEEVSEVIKIEPLVDQTINEPISDPTSGPTIVPVIEKDETKSFGDNKAIIIGIVAVLVIFAAVIFGFKYYDNLTAAEIIDIDQLHNENVIGNLDEEEAYFYNGYSFILADGLWWTEIPVEKGSEVLLKVPLHFGPRDLTNVTISGELNEYFNQGESLYITIDPTIRNQYYSLGLSELSFNVVKGIGRKPIAACTQEDSACEGREIVSCDNNTGNLPVVEIFVDEEVESNIEYDGSCIKITGHEYGIVRAVDLLLLIWYGVI